MERWGPYAIRVLEVALVVGLVALRLDDALIVVELGDDLGHGVDAGVDDDLQHDSGTGDDEGEGAKALMAKKLLMGQVTGEPELKHLWSFKCEMTYGKNVSCIVCNPEIPDLIAVA